MSIQYLVFVPYTKSSRRTKFHPTEATGPFAVLNRGAFNTVDEAVEWAAANLNGCPYKIEEYPYQED